MDWEEELLEPKEGLQIAPLIDVVFLLLIYFMVTATLRKSEADIGISLPGTVFQSQQIQMPVWSRFWWRLMSRTARVRRGSPIWN